MRSAFTLIELLIVIGILAILATVVILVINPAQMIKQSRDTVRISDLASLNQALSIYETSGLKYLGSPTTVYISLPDSSSTCGNIPGLPSLPSGYVYSCKPQSVYRNVDGTGWIPVDFTQVSFGSPLAQLPIDPINTMDNKNYYAYIPGGSWHISATLEADKYKMGGSEDKTSQDKGSYPSLYEVGTNLNLLPVDYSDPSLVGYWTFDEAIGTTAYDHSGHSNNGTLTNGPTWTANCKNNNSGCLSFDGSDDYVSVLDSNSLDLTEFTLEAWVYIDVLKNYNNIFEKGNDGTENYEILTLEGGQVSMAIFFTDGTRMYSADAPANTVIAGRWYHIVQTFKSGEWKFYKDGVALTNITSVTKTPKINALPLLIGKSSASGRFFDGLIDDVVIYNRALSAAEVSAFYNATK